MYPSFSHTNQCSCFELLRVCLHFWPILPFHDSNMSIRSGQLFRKTVLNRINGKASLKVIFSHTKQSLAQSVIGITQTIKGCNPSIGDLDYCASIGFTGGQCYSCNNTDNCNLSTNNSSLVSGVETRLAMLSATLLIGLNAFLFLGLLC